MHEAREELSVVPVRRGVMQQPDDRLRGAAVLGLEMREEAMGERKIGRELERARERLFRELVAAVVVFVIFSPHAMRAAERCPCRREPRIFLDGALKVLLRGL